jgi:hypothetical protein
MIPFAVVVLDVLRDGRSEVPLAERNQPVQAFFFDGSHEPFGVGVRIGGALGVRTTRIPASWRCRVWFI